MREHSNENMEIGSSILYTSSFFQQGNIYCLLLFTRVNLGPYKHSTTSSLSL